MARPAIDQVSSRVLSLAHYRLPRPPAPIPCPAPSPLMGEPNPPLPSPGSPLPRQDGEPFSPRKTRTLFELRIRTSWAIRYKFPSLPRVFEPRHLDVHSIHHVAFHVFPVPGRGCQNRKDVAPGGYAEAHRTALRDRYIGCLPADDAHRVDIKAARVKDAAFGQNDIPLVCRNRRRCKKEKERQKRQDGLCHPAPCDSSPITGLRVRHNPSRPEV